MDKLDSDNSLVNKAQRGDVLAYASLMQRYQQRTESIIAHHINDYSLIHDIRQEVFIKVYKNIDQFQQKSSFYTWLYSITRNTVFNYMKVNRHQPVMINSEYISKDKHFGSEELANPEAVTLSDELLSQLEYAYQILPDDLKLCWGLRELEGLSYAKIAQEINCPIGTVRSRIHRARALLKSSLND